MNITPPMGSGELNIPALETQKRTWYIRILMMRLSTAITIDHIHLSSVNCRTAGIGSEDRKQNKIVSKQSINI
ncbi:hypothetical protein ACUY4R_003215 [Kosakonia sp. BK9b]